MNIRHRHQGIHQPRLVGSAHDRLAIHTFVLLSGLGSAMKTHRIVDLDKKMIRPNPTSIAIAIGAF